MPVTCLRILALSTLLNIARICAFVPHFTRSDTLGVFDSNAKSSSFFIFHRASESTNLFAKRNENNEDDDEGDDDEISLSDDDWRSFRAKLVMGEKSQPAPEPSTDSESPSGSNSDFSNSDDEDLDGIGAVFEDLSQSVQKAMEDMTPLDPSQWAYDSGNVIEEGAVILGGVEQDFGFGLRQQYFHKAAILVLDHEDSTFTKGIILNRPTDLTLDDDINYGVKWRVWFGGDVQGLESDNPDIVCLHSLKNSRAKKASLPVMNDIQWTTFDNAKRLVQSGSADVRDFWVFCGYAGWGPGQLMGELDRKSWYMVATDSQTLLKELARQAEGADPRDAGLDTWSLLMNMIGRGETANKFVGNFDDLMLKEWALKHLLSDAGGGGAGPSNRSNPKSLPELVDKLMSRGKKAKDLEKKQAPSPINIGEGTLLRASSAERSPFLLDSQEFHKSLILIIAEDDNATVGVILNRPASKGLDIHVKDKNTGKIQGKTRIPLRFGGQYAIQGKKALLWLHCNENLRNTGVGSPVGESQKDGIWKCTPEDVMAAVSIKAGRPEDFIVVSGVSVWMKDNELGQGIDYEVENGKLEIVTQQMTESAWNFLLDQQEVLTKENIISNLQAAGAAWAQAAASNGKTKSNNGVINPPPIGGLGEGFDEDNDSMVFKSDVPVSKLSDDALRTWVTTFLLGAPSDE